MLTFIFSMMMILVFGKLLIFAVRMTWGLLKVLLGLVLLPGVIIAVFIAGLLYLAFPLLIIVGIVTLLLPKTN